MVERPDYILCVQHGWADSHRGIAKLATELATPNTFIVNPDLGWLKTWYRIDPLVNAVEKTVTEILSQHPDTPIRIIGHSMGGLIWLETLHRNPEWWSNVEALVLIASPVSGAGLARVVDPISIGIGIAKDLGVNRRKIAREVAKEIPTLSIAGNLHGRGSDGTIPVDSTKFAGAKWVCLDGISHPALKNHPRLVGVIQDFWENPEITPTSELNFVDQLIQRLRSIRGMTDATQQHFSRSTPYFTFDNGVTIRHWKPPIFVDWVFLESPDRECLYSGFVGWLHTHNLYEELEEIKLMNSLL